MFNTFFTYITYTYKLCNMCARKCFIDQTTMVWCKGERVLEFRVFHKFLNQNLTRVFKKSSNERDTFSETNSNQFKWQTLSVSQLFTPHHFDSFFNLVSILMTISLCNNTNIGNGSFIFIRWIYFWTLIDDTIALPITDLFVVCLMIQSSLLSNAFYTRAPQ